MDTITLKCPSCSQHFAVPENVRAPVTCPRCHTGVPLPPPVMGRPKGGGLTDFLEDELKPKNKMPIATPGVQQTMAALGIPQRAASPWKTPPPELQQMDGVLGAPPIYHARPSGFAGFVSTHKLVLSVIGLALLFFMISTITAHSLLGASISGAGVIVVLADGISERALLIFGACFAIAGLLIALGAWRSQALFGVERRVAEQWRLFELVVGIVVIAVLSILITWRAGVWFYRFYEVVHQAGMDRIDGSKLIRPVLWISLLWAVVIGQCVAVQFNAQRHGFFKLAGMAFIGDFVFIIVSGFLFYLSLYDNYNQNQGLTPRTVPLAADDRPIAAPMPAWNGTGMQARPVDPAVQHASRFVGPAAPDDRSPSGSVAAAGSIAKIQLGDGDDPAAARNRGMLKWQATVDTTPALKTPPMSRQPTITLPANYDLVLASKAGPLVVVRTNLPEEGSTFELWDLASGRSRGKISHDAGLSTGLVLSDDGKYLAGVSKGSKAIEVWSFETGKFVVRIPLESSNSPAIGFANNQTLLVLIPQADGLAMSVWTIGSDAKPKTYLLPPAVGAASGAAARAATTRAFGRQSDIDAVSPGGRFLAIYNSHRIWLIDLQEGRICGGLSVPGTKDDQFFAKPNGLAFSPDGTELVFHCGLFHGSQVTAWNVADGVLTAHWQLAHAVEHSWNKSAPIVHLADKSFWLLDGEVVVDRRTGREWPLGQPEGVHGPHDALRILGSADEDHLIVASDKMLSMWEVPRDVHGRIELEKLKIARDELPAGMLEKPLREQIEEQMPNLHPIEGDALVDASRAFRNSTQIDVLAKDDSQLMEAVRWYPAAKQPAVLVRWGIGIQSAQLDPEPPSTKLDLKQHTGPVGAAVVSALEKRINAGAFGQWPERGDARIRAVIPLGIGAREELLAAARQAGVDGVIVLELSRQVVVRKSESLLKARVSDADGEPQWVSPQSLASSRLAAQPDSATDLVNSFVSELMNQIDAKYKLQAMPAVTAEQVKDRVDRLTKPKSADVLTALAELRYYQAKGLLSTDAATAAYRTWLNADSAKLLATGGSQMRRAAVQQWLDNADRQATIRAAANP